MSDSNQAFPPPAEPSPVPPSDPSGSDRSRFRVGWAFLAVLLAPALLTMLSSGHDQAQPFFTFVGSIAAGLVCGYWLSFRVCRTMAGRILAGVPLALVFTVVSFAGCCAGCVVAGSAFRIGG